MPTSVFLGETANSNKSSSHRECSDPSVDTSKGPWARLRGPEHQGDQKTLIHCRKHKTFTNRWEVHAAAREVTWRAGVGGVGGG